MFKAATLTANCFIVHDAPALAAVANTRSFDHPVTIRYAYVAIRRSLATNDNQRGAIVGLGGSAADADAVLSEVHEWGEFPPATDAEKGASRKLERRCADQLHY